MSSTYAAALERIAVGLDEVAGIDPGYRTVTEKQQALVALSRLASRIEAERMRLLAASDDVAGATGARSAAAWLADAVRDSPGAVRRAAALADATESRWGRVGAALGAGAMNPAQARVIVEALDQLPDDLAERLRATAESYLVEQALTFGPRQLGKLGRHLLEVVAPEIADAAEHRRLLAEERRARARTQLFFQRRGDGSTDIAIRVPDQVADRLRVYLDGFVSPRGKALGEIDGLPLSRRRGEAFCAFLENLPASGLPRQGGSATTINVTIDLATLLGDLDRAGLATTSTGEAITAHEARRLACTAGIVPFVMSGKSVVHDQGRKQRLFTEAQRAALGLLHPECGEVDCEIPAAWCEAHHKTPWSRGGRTDLEDGTLLCSFHHHRAHDPGWQSHHHPNGSTTFHRRQ